MAENVGPDKELWDIVLFIRARLYMELNTLFKNIQFGIASYLFLVSKFITHKAVVQ